MHKNRNTRPRKNGPLTPEQTQIMNEICAPYRGKTRTPAAITAILAQFQARTGRTVERRRVVSLAGLKPPASEAIYEFRRASAEASLATVLARPSPPLKHTFEQFGAFAAALRREYLAQKAQELATHSCKRTHEAHPMESHWAAGARLYILTSLDQFDADEQAASTSPAVKKGTIFDPSPEYIEKRLAVLRRCHIESKRRENHRELSPSRLLCASSAFRCRHKTPA